MMKMEPPTIYMPAEAVDGVERCSAPSSDWTAAGCRSS